MLPDDSHTVGNQNEEKKIFFHANMTENGNEMVTREFLSMGIKRDSSTLRNLIGHATVSPVVSYYLLPLGRRFEPSRWTYSRQLHFGKRDGKGESLITRIDGLNAIKKKRKKKFVLMETF